LLTPIDPAKECFRTVVFVASSVPTTFEAPVTTLNTSGGTPVRSASSPTRVHENGVADAGPTTIVQPAASLGEPLRVSIAFGKFQD